MGELGLKWLLETGQSAFFPWLACFVQIEIFGNLRENIGRSLERIKHGIKLRGTILMEQD